MLVRTFSRAHHSFASAHACDSRARCCAVIETVAAKCSCPTAHATSIARAVVGACFTAHFASAYISRARVSCARTCLRERGRGPVQRPDCAWTYAARRDALRTGKTCIALVSFTRSGLRTSCETRTRADAPAWAHHCVAASPPGRRAKAAIACVAHYRGNTERGTCCRLQSCRANFSGVSLPREAIRLGLRREARWPKVAACATGNLVAVVPNADEPHGTPRPQSTSGAGLQ